MPGSECCYFPSFRDPLTVCPPGMEFNAEATYDGGACIDRYGYCSWIGVDHCGGEQALWDSMESTECCIGTSEPTDEPDMCSCEVSKAEFDDLKATVDELRASIGRTEADNNDVM